MVCHRAAIIFELWAQLFSQGSEILELTGAWTWIEDKPEQNGYYSIVTADRDSLVASLRQIASYAKQVAHSDGQLYLLHLGI